MAEMEENSVILGVESSNMEADQSTPNEVLPDGHSDSIHRDFTSEIFKIEIGNLPKIYSVSHLKKFLMKLKLKPKKVKMIQQRHFAYVTFNCNEDRELALKTLQNYEWRKKILTAKMAKAKEDPLIEKRKLQDEKNETSQTNERQDVKFIEVADTFNRICDVVTPLWNVPYEKQQIFKYEAMSQVLQKLGKELNAADVGKWVKQNRSENDGMCCPLEKLLPSPVCEGYRNKCEFTIGPGKDGISKTVGFRLSAYKEGCFAVVEPNDCSHIPQTMKHVTQEFQSYIRESQFDVFDPSTNKGFWKQLTVRCNVNEDIMCIIQMAPAQDMSEDDVKSEIEKLTKYFRDQNAFKLKSMYVEIGSSRRSEGTNGNILRHILGDQFIFEKLCDLTFRISPHAFFQVNTKSSEILYKAIQDWSDVSSNTTILDVCCGTGTIGLSMAKVGHFRHFIGKHGLPLRVKTVNAGLNTVVTSARMLLWALSTHNVKWVIGIEMCPEAVQDAKFNAKSNGISNVEYYCGKAEDVVVMATMKLDTGDSQVIAILDPPRAGCHARVLQAVRRCSKIEKLIYVSCSPNSVIKDFVSLCRPASKRTKGAPFQIVKALPIDLFPQTRYCELIVLLERSKT